MREIKYRALAKDKKTLVYSDVIGLSNFFHNYTEEYSGEIMEYTGIKDKNGTPIFEGDILKAGPNEYTGNFCNYEVKWEEDCAGFYPFVDHDYDAVTYYQKPLEIIGNVYENPELLEKI